MKIALISFHSFSEPGGVKTHLLALAKEYKKRGVGFKIIVPRRNLEENYGEDVILLGTAVHIDFGGGLADLVFNFLPASIEMTLLQENFNILHFHNATFPSFFQILLSPLSFQTTNVLTFHSDISRSKFFQKHPQFFDLFLHFCNWRIKGAIAVSRVAYKYLKGFKNKKTIIPNGVDLEIFNPQQKKLERFLDGKINLLFVGRIEKRKGLIYLLRAFQILEKKYQNLRLIIVGEGPEKENCQRFVEKNKLSEVVFLGKIEKELPSLYTTSHIFCAPSIFGESFGLVLLEAMASGLPVVGFANLGYRQLLKGTIGEKFLVQPKDYLSLAQKIAILIEKPILREKIKKWALKEVQKYSWSKIAEKTLSFYHLCQKNQSKGLI